MRKSSPLDGAFRFFSRNAWVLGIAVLSLPFVGCDKSVHDAVAVPEAQAKDISLSGRLLETDGTPVQGARISLGNMETSTDSNGSWKIEGSVSQVASGASSKSLPRLVYRLDDQILARDSLLSPVQTGILRWIRTLSVTGTLDEEPGVHVDSLIAWSLGTNVGAPVGVRLEYDSISRNYAGTLHLLGTSDGASYAYRVWIDVHGNGGRLTGRSDSLAAPNGGGAWKGAFDSLNVGGLVPHGSLSFPATALPGATVEFEAMNLSSQGAEYEWSEDGSVFTAGDDQYSIVLDPQASGTMEVRCRFTFEDGSQEIRTATVRILNLGLLGSLAEDGSFGFHESGDAIPEGVPVKGSTDGQGTQISLSAIDSGTARVDVTWGAVPMFGAWAGMDIALAQEGNDVDLSGKASLRFRYRTSSLKTQVEVSAMSPLYASNKTGSRVMMSAILPSTTEWKEATLVLELFEYQQWMLDLYTDDCALSWQDLVHRISGFRFQPKPAYNGDGVTLQLPDTWLEVSDIKLLAP